MVPGNVHCTAGRKMGFRGLDLCELSRMEPASTADFLTTLTNKPNTQVKECYLCLYVYEAISFYRMVNFLFPMVEIPFPDISLPKTQSVDFFCFRIVMSISLQTWKFGDLKPTIEKRRPQIWTCFWARHRNNIQQGNCNFLSTKRFINVNLSSQSIDCAAENSKPWVMPWDQRGDQPSKSWENVDFSSKSARHLAFFSQRHTM